MTTGMRTPSGVPQSVWNPNASVSVAMPDEKESKGVLLFDGAHVPTRSDCTRGDKGPKGVPMEMKELKAAEANKVAGSITPPRCPKKIPLPTWGPCRRFAGMSIRQQLLWANVVVTLILLCVTIVLTVGIIEQMKEDEELPTSKGNYVSETSSNVTNMLNDSSFQSESALPPSNVTTIPAKQN